ncbi:MAG: C4-type zinc ribbon domain-containing protein [Bacteroidales bacterium]|nr:C4-type zinc ribbon domain-containing protein [Bacteroides sp.]MCM1198309.1 C4-type zinc ribbon domain-containing protein [Clostridium sp.]MCM1502314.1 C4-type zinc ribbon domain-containing protein [Bacteroidales bacterium]
MAKKTKKIETPIDQRETFVSIQKSFADSDISVEEKLKTLYSLQQVDTEIDRIMQLRGELPLEVENLENEIADLKAKATHISESVDETNRKIAEYKNQIVEYDATIEKYKSQVEHVSNSREFDSLSKEIENLGLLRKIAEKNIGESREAILAKKMDIEAIKDRLDVKNADLKAKKEELSTIVESTSKEEERLRAKREENSDKIDARTMSAYDRIRSSNNNHLAVVSVFNGNACGGCFSTIAPQRLIDIASNKKMIICEYCGRILVNPDFE